MSMAPFNTFSVEELHMVTEGAFWMLVNLAAIAVGYTVAPRIIPRSANRHEEADLLASIPIFLVMTWLAWHHTLSTGSAVQERWAGTSQSSYAFLWLYVTRQLASFPFVFLGSMKLSDRLLMTLHHIISIIAYGGGLYTGRMHWFGTLNGCCETTSVFLNNLLLFKAIGYKGRLNAINGVTLWSTFLIFRLVLFPYWLYCFYSDVNGHPAVTSAKVSSFELIFYPCTTIVLLCMSIVWFVTLTKGMLKVIGVIGATDAKADAKAL
eukprot:CAMPEP_0174719388 /NCGR_PEP_ID=MMETSP1094-20130205/30962_1 /TAXON_ID=156173 /ORGANISM="Chrysochromulina brevifilum, Strain UTEX LB 985" /LENGTH=264 /DNA_ID=CAMNT_0015919673 /DNA_START=15 /DNA_END=809 /DNA_ORIENTATION=-